MTAGQPLRGFVGQSMSGRRQKAAGFARIYPPGSYTLIIPRTGIYEVAGWGTGTNQVSVGNSLSAAFGLRRLRMAKGQTVTINVGRGDRISGNSGSSGASTATNVTFPDGSQIVWTDPAPAGPTPGSVVGGDVNIAGASSGIAAVAAPSYGNYVGGTPTAAGPPVSPGSGGFIATQSYDSGGQISVTLVGPNLITL